jgi:predicted XRE-type DNA-binding protein
MAKKLLLAVTPSSGNVSADIGVCDPDEELAKAQLAGRIRDIVRLRRLTQVAASSAMGLDQPKVSALMNGRLSAFSSERLMRLLTRLGQDVEIVVESTPRRRGRGRFRVHGLAGGALALFVMLRAPGLSAQVPDAKPIDDRESFAVYSALLPDEAMRQMRRSMMVIQAEATVSPHLTDEAPGPCWPSGPSIETEWKSTLENLRTENAHTRTILSGFTLSVPYLVVPKADIRAIFTGQSGDWKAFAERYPNSAGYLALSAVGFDTDRTKAMVYMAHAYGNQGGFNSYHLLRRVAGHWQDARVPGVNTCQVQM